MTREEAIEYWDGLRKTFSSRLEKEENCFGRMHLQTTIDVLDVTLDCLREQEEWRWIPVTERLPKKSCEVIVGFVNGDGQFYSVYSVSYSKKHNAFNSRDYFSDCEVAKTAIHPDFWKPMPAPIRSVLRKEPPKEESE